jgi:hypothetical protein
MTSWRSFIFKSRFAHGHQHSYVQPVFHIEPYYYYTGAGGHHGAHGGGFGGPGLGLGAGGFGAHGVGYGGGYGYDNAYPAWAGKASTYFL